MMPQNLLGEKIQQRMSYSIGLLDLKRPEPVRVTEVIVVSDPGLLTQKVTLEVAALLFVSDTPPYSVADASVTVSTLEQQTPN